MEILIGIAVAIAFSLGVLAIYYSKISRKLDADLQTAHAAKQLAESALQNVQISLAERDAQLAATKEAQQTAQDRIAHLQAELSTQAQHLARQETQAAADRKYADEKLQEMAKTREEMQARFQTMAQEALKQQGESFSKANVEKLEAVLGPLREHVGHFEKELKSVNEHTLKDRAALREEIRHLTSRSEQISQEAVSLTRALKGDRQKQGAWGEMVLATILERSGLREGEEYELQAHRSGEDGQRLRPDVVVYLPENKSLVIDSKVSLSAYNDAIDAEDDAAALQARKRHAGAMRAHVTGLSKKAYHMAEGASVDYVIMFVPIEGALSEALREDPKLTEFALNYNITIATPTTLMMALRTVAYVRDSERRNANAEKIAQRAGHLYNKVAGFVENMEGLGTRLNQARDSYDAAVNQLSRGRGNVLSQIENLRSLGAHKGKPLKIDFDEDPQDDQSLRHTPTQNALKKDS